MSNQSEGGVCEACRGLGYITLEHPSCNIIRPKNMIFVQTCGECRLYDDDQAAAYALIGVHQIEPFTSICEDGGFHTLVELDEVIKGRLNNEQPE